MHEADLRARRVALNVSGAALLLAIAKGAAGFAAGSIALLSSALDPHRVAEAAGIPLAFVENFGVFIMLAHGFILTAMLWGAALAFLIDRQIGKAAAVLLTCSVLSVFGIMHSVLPTGGIYWPGSPALMGSHVPWHWAAAYAAFALMVVAFGAFASRSEDAAAPPEAA